MLDDNANDTCMNKQKRHWIFQVQRHKEHKPTQAETLTATDVVHFAQNKAQNSTWRFEEIENSWQACICTVYTVYTTKTSEATSA